jgi:hypothetical protein
VAVAVVLLLTSTVNVAAPEVAPPASDEFDAVTIEEMSPARSIAVQALLS